MANKRVHEIAKEQNLSSKEVLEALVAAGYEVTAAASSIDEDVALKTVRLDLPERDEVMRRFRARSGSPGGSAT